MQGGYGTSVSSVVNTLLSAREAWGLIPGLVKSDTVTLSNLSKKIKSSLYSPCYAEACNELRGPSPRLSAWATQLRRNVATVASRWRHCVDLTGPGIEPQTSRTDSVR